jgi:hypothetical protein
MLQVTESALEVCTLTVQQLSTGANTKCLRLIDRGNRMSISFECPRSDDEVVRGQGMVVLAVPAEIADTVSDKTLDVKDDGRFVLS